MLAVLFGTVASDPTPLPKPDAEAFHNHKSVYFNTIGHKYVRNYNEVPACAANNTKSWCLEDEEYPKYDIIYAAQYYQFYLLSQYADVVDLDTELSVDRPNSLLEETYLCPTETGYIRPLRIQDQHGKWRIIVNNVKLQYKTLTQTTRIEECLSSGEPCQLVPECMGSYCHQKNIYHRFLVYDPYETYYPFSVETFKLPSSCSCKLAESVYEH